MVKNLNRVRVVSQVLFLLNEVLSKFEELVLEISPILALTQDQQSFLLVFGIEVKEKKSQ